MLASCIPAQTPSILNTTPAAGSIITRTTVHNDLFSVVYPEGWRVITSAASAPLAVTLVSPDNCALIVVSSVPVAQTPASTSCTQSNIQTTSKTVSVSGKPITVIGSAPSAGWTDFLSEFNQIAASVAS